MLGFWAHLAKVRHGFALAGQSGGENADASAKFITPTEQVTLVKHVFFCLAALLAAA